MGERIEVGDHCYIAKPTVCCGRSDAMLTTLIVEKICVSISICKYCNYQNEDMTMALYNDTYTYAVEIFRLRKITPPAIKQSTTQRDEVPSCVS